MNKSSLLALVGLLMAVAGGVLSLCWDGIFKYLVATSLPMTPTSLTFLEWRNTTVPMILDVYFFNWTNPEHLFEEDFKPNLVEVGPYRFRDINLRSNITWNENGTLTYMRNKTWYFIPEESMGSLQDNITTLNIVSLSAAYVSRHSFFLYQLYLSGAMRISRQEVWLTKTVREFLFDGYSDALLTMASKMSHFVKLDLPTDKFGWFYPRNGTEKHDGVFNINNGASDVHSLGVVRAWNYRDRVDAFQGDCGRVYGSDGPFHTPFRSREEPVFLFTSDICRALRLDYEADQDIGGVQGYRYVATNTTFDNGQLDPDNWCNCEGECLPSGVINASTCMYGAPIFASLPHFLHADPSYLSQVQGLSPDESKHNFFLTVEPTTGVTISMAARMQINLLLQPSNVFAMYNNVPRIFFPMLWCEETMKLSPELHNLLNMMLKFPVMGMYGSIALVMVGVVLMGAVLMPAFLSRSLKKEKPQQLLLYSLVPSLVKSEKEKQPPAPQAEELVLMTKKREADLAT